MEDYSLLLSYIVNLELLATNLMFFYWVLLRTAKGILIVEWGWVRHQLHLSYPHSTAYLFAIICDFSMSQRVLFTLHLTDKQQHKQMKTEHFLLLNVVWSEITLPSSEQLIGVLFFLDVDKIKRKKKGLASNIHSGKSKEGI